MGTGVPTWKRFITPGDIYIQIYEIKMPSVHQPSFSSAWTEFVSISRWPGLLNRSTNDLWRNNFKITSNHSSLLDNITIMLFFSSVAPTTQTSNQTDLQLFNGRCNSCERNFLVYCQLHWSVPGRFGMSRTFKEPESGFELKWSS